VPTSGTPRYMEFFSWLGRLRVPAGTQLIMTRSAEIAKSLNKALEQATGEWIFLLGDDHTFAAETVFRLLGHNLPAVVPLNIMRVPPFPPVLFKGELGPNVQSLTWDEVPAGTGLWVLPNDVHAGSAGLLVRRNALDKIEKPIFRIGQYAPDTMNEDFWLFSQLRAQGIPTVVDLGCPMGHMNYFTIRPQVQNGAWAITFSQENKIALAIKGGSNDRPGSES